MIKQLIYSTFNAIHLYWILCSGFTGGSSNTLVKRFWRIFRTLTSIEQSRFIQFANGRYVNIMIMQLLILYTNEWLFLISFVFVGIFPTLKCNISSPIRTRIPSRNDWIKNMTLSLFHGDSSSPLIAHKSMFHVELPPYSSDETMYSKLMACIYSWI